MFFEESICLPYELVAHLQVQIPRLGAHGAHVGAGGRFWDHVDV